MIVILYKWQTHAKRMLKRIGSLKGERGAFLIEMLIAIALLGIVGVGLAGGLSSASKTLSTIDEWQTAKSIAASQMEYVKNQPYLLDYLPSTIPGDYADAGYEVVIEAADIPDRDLNIQKILITVLHGGRPIIMENDHNCTLAGYKVN